MQNESYFPAFYLTAVAGGGKGSGYARRIITDDPYNRNSYARLHRRAVKLSSHTNSTYGRKAIKKLKRFSRQKWGEYTVTGLTFCSGTFAIVQ